MANGHYISKVKLPGSEQVYNIKDAWAREAIENLSGKTNFLGVTTTALSDQATTNPITIGDESVTAVKGDIVVYGNKEFVFDGTKWYEFGDLSRLGDMAYVNWSSMTKTSATVLKGASATTNVSVTQPTPTKESVLGTGTTFGFSNGSVTLGTAATAKAIKSGATISVTAPTITVTPSKTHVIATASGTAVGADGTANAVTSVTATQGTGVTSVTPTTEKLVTTSIQGINGTENVSGVTSVSTKKMVTTTIPNVTGNAEVSFSAVTANTPVTFNAVDSASDVNIPNVTSVGTADTWSFTMGSGDAAETLIIGGTNGTVPTLGEALTATKVTTASTTASNVAVATKTATNTVLGESITAATGGLATNGTGDAVVDGVNVAGVTVAKAAADPITVATGTISTAGTGSEVVVAVTAATSDVVTSVTSATTTVLTGVKVTTEPTINVATAATGGVEVATGIANATASVPTASFEAGSEIDVVTAMPTEGNTVTGTVTATPASVDAVTAIGNIALANTNITVNVDTESVLKDITKPE